MCDKVNRSKISFELKKFDDSSKSLIVDVKWGSIVVSFLGKTKTYRDAIIWRTGHKKWDWSLSNTHHIPGIQIPEIKFLIEDCQCNFIILTTGFENVLNVDKNTIKWLIKNDVQYIILNSADAIKVYNESSDNAMGILFHSTC